MKTTLTTIALALLLCCVCHAQSTTVEYGSPADLKGVRKIFVDTGVEMEVRENILKELGKNKKKVPDLEIVSTPEDAEVVLAFGGMSRSYLAGANTLPSVSGGSTSTAVYNTVTEGGGVVFKPVGENRIRLLMSFRNTRRMRWERRPSTNFAREFVRAYMDANGIKR